VILFTCIAEISTVDEEPIFRILPLKLPFFQHCKKQKTKKRRTNQIPKSETITEKNKRKSKAGSCNQEENHTISDGMTFYQELN
jgi:hypothetical protein